ncbi:hypothetical protein ACHQM5_029721 [Ranunculus cassubicifolius]
MNNLAEITLIFTQIASHLQTSPNSTQNPQILPLISSFNQSLNLNENPNSRVSFMDKALSLMCFKSPQVFDEEIKCLVETIVSVLSCCVSCEVLKVGQTERLRVGGLITSRDCVKLMEMLLDIGGKLEGYDTLKQMLVIAVLRVAVSASRYESLFSLEPLLISEPQYPKSTSVSEFQYLVHKEIDINNHEIPLRLLLWHLDPLTLKNDVSNILRELVDSPFIDLKKELHDRMTWRTIVICLVLSPITFIETRSLLHNWFLTTGLASILELQTKLVSSLLDILAQPMQWNIPMELGLKLPFSNAYFTNDHHLVSMLSGPISAESFLDIVHHIRGSNTRSRSKENSTWRKKVDDKSIWSMLMAFPEWFYFASMLLFSKKGCETDYFVRCTSEQTRDAAARYLAYCLSPMSESHSDSMVKYLVQLSDSWILKQGSSDTYQSTSSHFKNFKRPRMRSNKKENSGQILIAWINEFHQCHTKHWTDIRKSYKFKGGETHNLLYRKISLGIFIGCSKLDDKGSELLLHYASTGETLDTRDVHLKLKKAENIIAGVCLVFEVCDVVVNMWSSVFETDEGHLSFIRLLKVKAVGFMVKCITRLLEDSCKMSSLMDLQKRLEEWSYQGGEVIQGLEPLKDVLGALNSRLHS